MKYYHFALIYPTYLFDYDAVDTYANCYEAGAQALRRNKKAVAILIWSDTTAIVIKRKMALEGKTVNEK